eukprot:3235659-Pyramimonas_sp.AAC.1
MGARRPLAAHSEAPAPPERASRRPKRAPGWPNAPPTELRGAPGQSKRAQETSRRPWLEGKRSVALA